MDLDILYKTTVLFFYFIAASGQCEYEGEGGEGGILTVNSNVANG
jgi:hypothetical protein